MSERKQASTVTVLHASQFHLLTAAPSIVTVSVCLPDSALACQKLYPVMREERLKNPAIKTCALSSPFIPCMLYAPDSSALLVQRLSYEGNNTGHTIVKMDLHSQFTSFSHAISLNMMKTNKAWVDADTDAKKAAIVPFDPLSPAGQAAVLGDLGLLKLKASERESYETILAQYHAFVKWGVTPADPHAAPRYVSRLRFDQSTTETVHALHNGAVPVPFFDNPAMQALQLECARGDICRLESKGLKLFTLQHMTTAAGYLPGCVLWLLNCILANTSDKKKANVKPEHMLNYIAMLHQHLKIPQIKADCLEELKKYKVPDSDELNSAEASELKRVDDLVDFTGTTPDNDNTVKEAVGKLTDAIARSKADRSPLAVQCIKALDDARTKIRQLRALPFIAAEVKKQQEEAQAKKEALMKQKQDAIDIEARLQLVAQKAKETADATAKEQSEAAQAAAAAEDAEQKRKAEVTADALKKRSDAEAAAAAQAASAAAAAHAQAVSASQSMDSAVEEEKAADQAMSILPESLPAPTTLNVGLGPHVRRGRKEKAIVQITRQAEEEIADLTMLQQDEQSSAKGDEASDISGPSAASAASAASAVSAASARGRGRKLNYLHTHFPTHLADVSTWLARKTQQILTAEPGAAELYDFIVMHPPGIHYGSGEYTDQRLKTAELSKVVSDAATLLKPGATMAIHCTDEQYARLMNMALTINPPNAINHFGCRWESAPLVWYSTGSGEGGRHNQSSALVSVTHPILLMHKFDENNKYTANYLFSDHTHYKHAGPQSNVWIIPARSIEQRLTVDKNNWGPIVAASKSRKEQEREKYLEKNADGTYTIPVATMLELNASRPELEIEKHEGASYVAPGEKRGYQGERTERLILDKSEIPADVTEHLLKIFLLPSKEGSYGGQRVLDLYAGTQSTASVATRFLDLTVENVDFDPVVTAAAKLRLMKRIGEALAEEGDGGLQADDFQHSLFYRFRVDGLTDSEVKQHGQNLGVELHRQRADFYRRVATRETHCKDADAGCKNCGKDLMDLERIADVVEWRSKHGICPLARRDGFCSAACQEFDAHVTCVEGKPPGGRVLRNFDNQNYASFAVRDEAAPRPTGTKAEIDALLWKRLPEPKRDALDYTSREAVKRDAAMWSLEVKFKAESEGGDVVAVAVHTRAAVEAGDTMGALTGDLVEEDTEASRAFNRPPVDISSTFWSHLTSCAHKGKAMKRQWLIPSRLCSASYIKPSDAAHPANVTIAPNYLLMSPYSRLSDHSIFPPGGISIIANRSIASGEQLFYDAKQLVRRRRDMYSVTPVLTSDAHEEPNLMEDVVEGAAAAAASSSSFISYVEPWFADEWPLQLEGQKQLLPPKRKPKPKSVPKESKWIEADVVSDDDDEIEQKFKPARSPPKRGTSGRTSTRNLPADLRTALFAEGVQHQLMFVDGVGFAPKPEDETWFNKNATAMQAVQRHNAVLQAQWAVEGTEAQYGLATDESKEAFPIDQLVAEKMTEYAKSVASEGLPNACRERLRRLPKLALMEIKALTAHGLDTDTQEELRMRLGEDATGLNACLSHTYRSLVAEDVDKLNQFSLRKRRVFWDKLLSSDSLRAFICRTAQRQQRIKMWQLCKMFLQQYNKILDALDKRVKAGQSSGAQPQRRQH